MDKTLKEHLQEAREKRWKQTDTEKRKEHSAKMNKARWSKRENGAVEKPSEGENGEIGEKG